MRLKENITLKDIANELNLSMVAVSKALRGHPDISQETAKLIRQTATALGYIPNSPARILSSRKSKTIGLVVPKISDHYYSILVESVYNAAYKKGYEIVLSISQDSEKREIDNLKALLALRVDGLILAISDNTLNDSFNNYIKRKGIPIILINKYIKDSSFNTITLDVRDGAFKAVEHAVNMGYKKIGFITNNHDILVSKECYLGVKDAMQKYNINMNPNWVKFGDLNESAGYDSLMQIYRSGDFPEFLVSTSNQITFGINSAAKELGLKIPDDLNIICLGNKKYTEYLTPSLSYMELPTNILGYKSVEILLENINLGDSFQSKHIKIPTNLILQETCLNKRN